jgi:transcriptional regulator with XRE-family HTH domain
MSQHKKLEKPQISELSKRIREFRKRAKLSQGELGERLGVSGNYVSMIELSKKEPGPSLQKLFEQLEHSPLYARMGGSGVPPNGVYAMLSLETLETNFGEVAEKLAKVGPAEKKRVVGNLREMLEEIEQRLLASSGVLSEAQQIAVKASKTGGSRGTK